MNAQGRTRLCIRTPASGSFPDYSKRQGNEIACTLFLGLYLPTENSMARECAPREFLIFPIFCHDLIIIFIDDHPRPISRQGSEIEIRIFKDGDQVAKN